MFTADSTSQSLLERAKGQDQVAWERLVTLYIPILYRWNLRAGLSDDLSAEIAHIAIIAVWKGLKNYRPDGRKRSFRRWLSVVLRNAAAEHHRRHQTEPQGAGGSTAWQRLNELADSMNEDPEPVLNTETIGVVQRALGLIESDFEERIARAFRRYVLDGVSAADVAQELDISVQSVYQAKSRILRRLRSELEGLLD